MFRSNGKVEWVDGCLDRPGWLARYTLAGGSFRSLPASQEVTNRLCAVWIARDDVDSVRVADRESQRVIGVMSKILQRGFAPPVHPSVEQELLTLLEVPFTVLTPFNRSISYD
jgi:hypothetical protein